MVQGSTEIKVVNRAGNQKTTFPLTPKSTVRDLKKHIASTTRMAVVRQYLTLGPASAAAKRIVLDDDSKLLSEFALSENQDTVTLKDLGPQVSWRTVFLVEYGGPIFIFLLAFLISSAQKGELAFTQKLALGLALIHFIKREYETVFVHIFSHGTMPLRNIFKNSFHYWVLCGVAISIELFFFWTNPGYSEGFQYILAGIFLVFQFLNFMCHVTLRNLRTGGSSTQRGIPYGWGFDLVSCANYFWESCVWLTFAILVRCWTAYIFLAVSFGQMTIWALKKHRGYRREFDGKEGRKAYPRGRKAIVPFVI